MDQRARMPAVAGSFYPRSASQLRVEVGRLLDGARPPRIEVAMQALISPHAGYRYSGPVAATGYRALSELRPPPARVAVVGPSHFLPFSGLALPGHSVMGTSMGDVAVDEAASEHLVSVGLARRSEAAHRREHSLEVQLPFLQALLGRFTVVPLLVGDRDPEPARQAVAWLAGEGFFIVVSSDLSHYLSNRAAHLMDQATADAILRLDDAGIDPEGACGGVAIRAALMVARELGWEAQQLDLRTSGDVTGEVDRVVGYGSFALGLAAT